MSELQPQARVYKRTRTLKFKKYIYYRRKENLQLNGTYIAAHD